MSILKIRLPFSKLTFSIPLRVVIIVPLLLQVISIVSVVGYISYQNGQKNVEEIANSLIREKSNRINQSIYNYLLTFPIAEVSGDDVLTDLEKLIPNFFAIRQARYQLVTKQIFKQLGSPSMSQFMKTLVNRPHTLLYLTDRQGYLRAATTGESIIFAAQVMPTQDLLALNSGDRLIQITAQEITRRFHSFSQITQTVDQQGFTFTLDINQKRYFINISTFKFPSNLIASTVTDNSLEIFNVLVVPESDFIVDPIADPYRNNWNLFWLIGMAALIAIAIGSVIAHLISEPITKISAVTQKISNVYFTTPDSPTPIKEFQDLNRSFAEMSHHLQDYFESLIKKELYVANLLEVLPIGVAIHHADGSLSYLNEFAKNLLEGAPSTVISNNYLSNTYKIYIEGTDTLYPIDQLPSSQALLGATCYLDNLEVVRGDLRIPIEAKAAPILNIDGGIDGAIVVFRDISDRRNSEKIIADYNRQLEIDVQQRTQQLQQEIREREIIENNLRKTKMELTLANQELERLVNIDGLTQIVNRRGFDQRLSWEWRRLAREGQSIALLMFDVDFFKLYNDHYGHQLGDECLSQIAKSVDSVMRRPADLVARYGGEEFIAILPNTNLEGALLIATQIHASIRQLAIPHHKSPVSDWVTISLGISCMVPEPKQSPHFLVNQADQALYQAKHKGRNRSVVFIPEES